MLFFRAHLHLQVLDVINTCENDRLYSAIVISVEIHIAEITKQG